MNSWSVEQEEQLIAMNAKGLSLKTMAQRLNRTENAVRLRVKHLGFTLNVKGRRWTKKEERAFVDNWRDETINNDALVRKHNRTWHALQEKAVSMHLGARPYNSMYLSIKDICVSMSVSTDRVYRWIKCGGLKTHKGGSKRRKYLVSVDDLLVFLEEHQAWFLATKIDPYLFCGDEGEPEWLIKKRSYDKDHDRSNHQMLWSNDEDRKLQQMFLNGASLQTLAKEFHRSASAIRTHLYVIGCEIKRPDMYTEDELDFLREYSDYYTLEELSTKLSNRSVKGIEYKCKTMGIPYHFSKSQCRSLEEFSSVVDQEISVDQDDSTDMDPVELMFEKKTDDFDKPISVHRQFNMDHLFAV